MARQWLSNLVGFTSKSTYSKLGMGHTQNMFVETRNANESGFDRVLLPFGGYDKVCDCDGVFRGSYVVKNGFDGKESLYTVFGERLYILVDGVNYMVGRLGSVSGRCSFCETAGYGFAHPRLIIADGEQLYCVDITLVPAQQAVDFRTINLPLKVGSTTQAIQPSHCAYAYGHLVVNDVGSDAFWTSCFQPFVPDAVTGAVDYDIFMCNDSPTENRERPYYKTGYVTYSEWKGDITKALISNGSNIITFGTNSVQVFNYNSVSLSKDYLAGDVWTSPIQGSSNVGIVAPESLAQFGDRCIFLGKAELGGVEVFSIGSDAAPKVISTPDIERAISKYDVESAYGFCFMVAQHPFYAITFPVDKVTMVYDFREEGWVNLESRSTGYFRYRYPAFVGTTLYFGCDGAVVKYTEDKWNEHDETPITRKRCGGLVSAKGAEILVKEISLETNSGDYSLIGNEHAVILFRYSRDGKTFNTYETESMGHAGQYDWPTRFYDLDTAFNLSVEVSCSDNVPFCIMGMDADVENCIY